MKVLILLIISRFGLCQDNIEASVDILKPKPGLRDCTLPREFTVSVRTHNDSVTLQLETSTSVKKSTPVYVSRQDEEGNPIIVRDTVLEFEGTAEYQDVTHMANIEVSCLIKEENQPYYLFEGLLLFSGPLLYKLKPTGTGSASSDTKYTLTSSLVHIQLIENDDEGENGQSGSESEIMESKSLRKKRQIRVPIYVDVIAVIAFSIYERWYSRSTQLSDTLKDQETKQGIKRHFAHLVNGVHVRFKTASLLYNINLVGYIFEDRQSEKPFQSAIDNEKKIDGDKLLDDTRQWKADTPGFPDNDHVVVFTANDLFADTRNLLGYAYVGTICKKTYSSVSAVEYTDNLVDDMLVTTHEVGHALSARHDGEYNNTCSSTYKYIMSSGYSKTQVLDHNNYYVFSTCSLNYFQTFIQGILTYGTNAQRRCLQTRLKSSSVTNITGTMPGQHYDVHTQCQMMFGPGYVLRSDVSIGNSENICKRMVCGKERVESSRNAAEGTSCGNKKWCIAGQCVFSTDAPEKNNPDCLFGNQPIVYPENKTCAELISATPRLCYDPDYLKACCETCPLYKRNDENCTYGDRYNDCYTLTQDTKRLCYNEGNAKGCCETCPAFMSAVENCTYGDRFSDCYQVTQDTKSLCYNEANAKGCCETCPAFMSAVDCPYGDNTLSGPCVRGDCISSSSDYIERCCDTCRGITSQSNTNTTTTAPTTTTTLQPTTTTPTTTTTMPTTITVPATTRTTSTTTSTTTTTSPTTTTTTSTTTTTTPTTITTTPTTTTSPPTTTTTSTTTTTAPTTTTTTPTTTTATTTTMPTTTRTTPTTNTTASINTPTNSPTTATTTPSTATTEPTTTIVSSTATSISAPTPCYVAAEIVVSYFVVIVSGSK